MNIKKLLLISLFIGCLTVNLYGQIYPTPHNFTVSKGEYTDSIEIRWSRPTPPEFGEGFEAGIVPPEGWDTTVTNQDSSWQIIDHPAYAHSGSYAACVPYTFSEGEFLGFDENLIENGDFSVWEDGLPQNWQKSNDDITIDSLAQDSLYLAFSASTQRFRYFYQPISVEKYAKYKLTFQSKQDSLEETYKIELYNSTSNRVLWSKDDLNNIEWQTFEFDIHTSSCDSIEVRLYPSNKGNTTYWDNISLKKYNYIPNQDETLISTSYRVKDGDKLVFWLGTSKTYGVNSPVYILVLQDEGATWSDTLLVCDGSDNTTDLWEYKEYSHDLSDFVESEIKIGFRYIGGNGDLVCLDDVSIGGETKTDLAFFVVPVEKPTTRFTSRAPVNTKDGKATMLTGYSLERRFWDKERYTEIFSAPSAYDTIFFDTDVGIDTAYVYRCRAIYNDVIPSEYTTEDSIGYVIDNNPPNKPLGVSTSFNELASSGIFTIAWKSHGWVDDTTWINLSRDAEKFNVYDLYQDTTLFGTVGVNFGEIDYAILKGQSIPARPHIFGIASVDVAGNESDFTDPVVVLPPPFLQVSSNETDLENKIKLTISKKYTNESCAPSDSIRIYKGTDPDSMDFLIGIRPEETIQEVAYIDTAVINGVTYSYYATFVYDLGESIQSITRTRAPDFIIHNIENLEVDTTETGLSFSWDEPDDPDYAGVYLYTQKTYPRVAVDTAYVGTISIEFDSPGVFTFYFVPFDWYGNKDIETEIILEYVNVSLFEVTEDFEDGLPLDWKMYSPDNGDGIWKVSDNGSSQWFEIPAGDGMYAYLNDDSLGQFGNTNCYLILPEVSELVPGEDQVFLKFNSYFEEEYDGKAYLSLKNNEDWIDIQEIPSYVDSWILQVLDLSSYIPESGEFQLAFHYNDHGTWSQGWAIDNVTLLTTSENMKTSLGKDIVIDTPFKISPNFPNPFSQSTNFSFYLAQPSTVSLEIYNILGQKVRTVARNEEFPKGKAYLKWDGMSDSGKRVAPGVYLYRIDINNDTRVNKMMLLN
jgi:hypothetical protein